MRVLKTFFIHLYLTGAISVKKLVIPLTGMNGPCLSQIYSIYAFDEELRSLLRRYIEITETFYKNLIGTEFALLKCKNPPHDQHYNEANYYDKKGIRSILDRFEKERRYYRESDIVKHHKAKYANKMPLWVMMELK